MNQLRFGCQTITWGQDQREFIPQVLKGVAQAGYEGFEIGFRHIQHIPPVELKKQMDALNIKLIGVHVGGNLQDRTQASGEQAILDVVLDYLNAIGATRLMYSGLRFEETAQFRRDLAMLSDADEAARKRGVDLLYHNHDWEFQDGGRVIETLINDTDVRFCPDIGWIMRGLGNIEGVLPFLDRIRLRIGAMHMKDFATVNATDGRINTVLLGEGVAPLKQSAAWAEEHKPRLWLIAEQDSASGSPEDAVTANARYLRSIVGTRAAASR